jgi:hypothetical protein
MTAIGSPPFADHLEPEPGPFVYSHFPKGMNDNLSRLISSANFGVETGVVLIMDEKFALVTLQKTGNGTQIVRYSECPEVGNWDAPEASSRPIDAECFQKIAKLWQMEVSKTSYGKRKRMIFGGMGYHFFSFANGEGRSGFAVSVGNPSELPSLSNLLTIANLLAAYAKSESPFANNIMKEIKRRVYVQSKRDEHQSSKGK